MAESSDDGFRPPRQARAKETLARLLEATHDLLRERAFDDITVDDIVQRAGSSVGSFYARFDDKEAALLALIDDRREPQADLARVFYSVEAWKGRPLVEIVSGCVEMTCEIYAGDEPPFRDAALLSLRDDRFLRRRYEALRLVGHRWVDLLASRAHEIDRPGDGRRWARLTWEHVVAHLDWRLLYGPFLHTEESHQDWVASLTVDCLRILGFRGDEVVAPNRAATPIPLDPGNRPRQRPAPVQERGVESEGAFVDALADILRTVPFEDVTVKDVAAAAHRSTGAFYSFFAGKDDVLDALVQREEATFLPLVQSYFDPEIWSRRTLEEAVRTFAEDTVSLYRRFLPISRAGAVRAAMHVEMGAHRVIQHRRIAAMFRSVSLNWISEAQTPRPDEIYAHIAVVMDQELLYGPIVPETLRTEEELVDDLVDTCLALVGRREVVPNPV